MLGTRDLLERQHDRQAFQNFKAFKSLIATPASWASPVQLKARTKIFVKLAAGVGVNTAVFTVNGKSYYVKAGTAAGVAVPVGYFEKKETLTAVYGSTIDLLVQHPQGKLYKIAGK